MIKNAHISLERSSKYREETKNVIKYTLMLKYKPEAVAPNDALKSIIYEMKKNCRMLFVTDTTETILYNFFGDNREKKGLTYLSGIELDERERAKKSSIISDMILQDCVMKAYHTVLTSYLSSDMIGPYGLVNTENSKAFSYLERRVDSLTVEEGGHVRGSSVKGQDESGTLEEKPESSNSDINKGKSSKAGAFINKLRPREELLKGKLAFLVAKGEEGVEEHDKEKRGETLRFYKQFTILDKLLWKKTMPGLRLWNCQTEKMSKESILSAHESLLKHLTPYLFMQKKGSFVLEERIPKGTISEVLYHYYVTESVFNVNLLYSLLNNIRRVQEEQKILLYGEDTLKVISSCAKLPNAFTRNYLVKFAFDHIDPMTRSYSDYWHHHGRRLSGGNGIIENLNPPGFSLGQWILQYEYFMRYFSEYVFPVYHGYFMCMLMDSIEMTYPDAAHKEHLGIAKELLEKYIESNYEQFMKPNILKDEGEDIFSEKDFALLYNSFTKETLDELSKLLFSSTRSINLEPLDLNHCRAMFGQRLHSFVTEEWKRSWIVASKPIDKEIFAVKTDEKGEG